MFQYAFGKSVADSIGTRLYVDPGFFASQQDDSDVAHREFALHIFNQNIGIVSNEATKAFTHPNMIQRAFNKLGVKVKSSYQEQSLRADKSFFNNITDNTYFDGYWQSEEYFKNIESTIRASFVFKERLNEPSAEIAKSLLMQPNAVSVHIRRSDYVTSQRTNQIHGSCSVAYYLNAIAHFKNIVPNAHFYLFSDDPAWVTQNLLKIIPNATVIAHNSGTSWQDMALMSKCSHHIIANSSFSWWGAWLNPNKNKIVMAPKNWFKTRDRYYDDADIVPKSWIKLAND